MGREGFKPGLESLRGLAALAVLITHAQLVFLTTEPGGNPYAFEVLIWINYLIRSGPAVILFFVLSGFVLGGALQRNDEYKTFALRRILRIWPAMVISIAIAYWLQVNFRPPTFENTGEWYINLFANPPSVADFFRNLLLMKANINAVTWTMIPEVICSLLLPIAWAAHKRTGIAVSIFVLIALCAISYYPQDTTLQFAFCFYAGMLAPTLPGIPRIPAMILASASLLIMYYFSAKFTAYSYPMKLGCGFSALALIYAVSHGAFETALSVKPLRFLGRISYSLYLLHIPVLYALSIFVMTHRDTFHLNTDMRVFFVATTLAITAAISTLVFRYIEKPGISLGHSLRVTPSISP